MKKWSENIRDWFFWHHDAIITGVIVALVITLVAVVLVAVAIDENINNSINWIADPANPASPVHNLFTNKF